MPDPRYDVCLVLLPPNDPGDLDSDCEEDLDWTEAEFIRVLACSLPVIPVLAQVGRCLKIWRKRRKDMGENCNSRQLEALQRGVERVRDGLVAWKLLVGTEPGWPIFRLGMEGHLSF